MSANLEAIPKDTKVPPGGTRLFFEDWDEYFLAIAEIVACKSKDPKCQVGAVLVTPDAVVISTGVQRPCPRRFRQRESPARH